MIDSDFLARVTARGGNPDCLHCRLATLIEDHLEAWGGARPASDEILHALAELSGDALRNMRGGGTVEAGTELARFVVAMGLRCGVNVSPHLRAAIHHKLH